MKNFRNNSLFALLVISFVIGVSFVDRSGPRFTAPNYAARADTTKEPKMTLEEITLQPMTVLVIRDTATTVDDIGPVLGRNYGLIGVFMRNNSLVFSGPPMAWYYTEKGPFVMEAGIPVNKKPSATDPKIEVREMKADKAIVVHFWGPYEQTFKAYQKIKDWMKANNKQPVGAPFDLYITDPMSQTDPYKVQTDICQVYR